MRIKLFDYLQAGGGAVAQGPVGSVQLCRIHSINKSLQVTPQRRMCNIWLIMGFSIV